MSSSSIPVIHSSTDWCRGKLGMAPRGKVITPFSHMVGGYNPTPSLDVCRWCVGACALHEQFGTKLVSMV